MKIPQSTLMNGVIWAGLRMKSRLLHRKQKQLAKNMKRNTKKKKNQQRMKMMS